MPKEAGLEIYREMTLVKEAFYYFDKEGRRCFDCVFCGKKTQTVDTEREYLPAACAHPELKKLGITGLMCSRCYNWDTDKFKRHDSPTNREPLRHKSGRFLGLNGWLDEQNESMERFFK